MTVAPMHFEGKAHPMTVITPLRPRRTWLASIVLAVFRRLPLGVVRQLAFIHFARWMIVRRNAFPRLDPAQPAEALQNDLFLFSTNFNGPWDQYIDAFGRVSGVRGGVDWLWWTSSGFPGAWPLRAFKHYIRDFEYPLDLYYNAYPGASVRDIGVALQLEIALDAFLADTVEPLEDAEFTRRYAAFLDEVAPSLSAVGGLWHGLPCKRREHPLGLHQ